MNTFILVVCAYYIGWVAAHARVAHECKMLGKFYVGKKVYHCSDIEEKS